MMPNDVTTTREAPAMETSEIRMLRAFRVFVAERSVSRASERLGLSQPATSHLLARDTLRSATNTRKARSMRISEVSMAGASLVVVKSFGIMDSRHSPCDIVHEAGAP